MTLTVFERFKELHAKGYTLDMVFLLTLIKGEEEITTDSFKINAILTTMERKGLITAENKITVDGQQLLDFTDASIESPAKIVKKKVDDEFERFWRTFPASDTFTYKGVSFQGSRALRINKDDCKLKLKSILNEGEHSIDTIIAAIEYDVKAKKEASIKNRTNKLSYVQNSLTYLRQRSYEPFIELISEGTVINETQIIKETEI